jgi:hypothetical protein
MNDDLFLYADEAVDHIEEALRRATEIREASKEEGPFSQSVKRARVVSQRNSIHHAITSCNDAITALLAAREET